MIPAISNPKIRLQDCLENEAENIAINPTPAIIQMRDVKCQIGMKDEIK